VIVQGYKCAGVVQEYTGTGVVVLGCKRSTGLHGYICRKRVQAYRCYTEVQCVQEW